MGDFHRHGQRHVCRNGLRRNKTEPVHAFGLRVRQLRLLLAGFGPCRASSGSRGSGHTRSGASPSGFIGVVWLREQLQCRPELRMRQLLRLQFLRLQHLLRLQRLLP